MSKDRFCFPAMSAEVEFVARHVDEVKDIEEGNISVDQTMQSLLHTVVARANHDVQEMLRAAQDRLSNECKGLAVLKWSRVAPDVWELSASIQQNARMKRSIGWIGVYVECSNTPALVGWAQPRRGLDGRRELAAACEKAVPGTYVASDNPRRHPLVDDDFVVWFDEKLARKSRDDVIDRAAKKAKQFLKRAKPVMVGLAAK